MGSISSLQSLLASDLYLFNYSSAFFSLSYRYFYSFYKFLIVCSSSFILFSRPFPPFSSFSITFIEVLSEFGSLLIDLFLVDYNVCWSVPTSRWRVGDEDLWMFDWQLFKLTWFRSSLACKASLLFLNSSTVSPSFIFPPFFYIFNLGFIAKTLSFCLSSCPFIVWVVRPGYFDI